MIQNINKRTIVLTIIFLLILVVIALLIGNFTFSYVGANISDDVNTEGETTASGDTIIFSKGNDLSLYATTDNFNALSGNLTDTTNPSARLIASSRTNNATSTYYAGIRIYENTFTYSNGNTAEVILTVKDETGNIVTTSSDNNLTYVEVSDKDGNSITGFDITGKTGAFNISANHPISTTSSTTGETQTWTFTITLVNYNHDQSINENATLDMEVVLQKEEITFTLANTCSSGGNLVECLQKFYSIVGEGYGGLYYHDGQGTYINADQEAGDNSYRYSGANPNNYVCFGSDVEVCPEENLYRIIGVFDDNEDGIYNVKLIKGDYTTSALLGVDGKDYFGSYVSFWGPSYTYKGNMLQENIAAYSFNNDYSVSEIGINNWTTSELNKINFNTNFLNYLDSINSKWTDMIAINTWLLGGMGVNDGTAKSFFIGERNNLGYENNPTIYDAKIGLIYPSDYGYATIPENWTTNLYDYNTELNTDSNWLYIGLFEWSITPIVTTSSNTYYIHSDGRISNGYSSNVFAVRPVFYLQTNVILTSGDGSKSNPFRLT